jgi:hypothetical protein
MRGAVLVVSLVMLASTAHAQPGVPPPASPSPWTDDGSAPDLTLHADPLAPPAAVTPTTDPTISGRYHPLAAGLTVGGMYVAFAGWMYIAWYQHHADTGYKFGGDDENCDPLHGSSEARCILFGWAGDTTYAGGEDKFGHAWATMALARLTDEILEQWGGFDHTKSMLVGTGLSWLLFVGVEVRDGFNFEFSYSDLGGDTVGALAALALMYWPRLDEMFDYRVQYFPSQIYLQKLDGHSMCRAGTCSRWNIAEDYSGETYLLAFHLGSIHSLRAIPTWGTLARFVDVAVGYDTRNYKPTPDDPKVNLPTKEAFIGVSFNAQGFFDWLLEDSSHQTLRKVTHGLGEVFNLPFSSAGVLRLEHSACQTCTPSQDGAL